MSAFRTLSIGGATYDLFVRTGKDIVCDDCEPKSLLLPVGRKIRVQEVIETCGGGAANSSVGLARLGLETSFCGIIGSDQWGERMLQNLQKEGVDVSGATVIENETSSFSIILNTDSGERVILYSTGANAHLHDATFDKDRAGRMDWLYFNHIHEKSHVIEDDIVRILSDYPRVGMTWNPGGRQLKKGMEDPGNAALLRRTGLLLLNKEEAAVFTGKSTSEDAIRVLLKAGAMHVCITDGPHGSLASDGRTLYFCGAVEGAPVTDSTGAGDAFGTGATWAIVTGLGLPIALQAGTINATSVLGSIGAQAGLLTHTEMQNRLNQSALRVEARPF